MTLVNIDNLPDCLTYNNCFRVEWTFPNINNAYNKLVEIASELPRVTVLESQGKYWHGVVRSRIFKFPDDLEILQIPNRNKIQVRWASRIGVGDFGVNENRVNNLYSRLKESL